jgi:UDP-N-acetylglucosamine 2-epimerase (non-hydrolysing)
MAPVILALRARPEIFDSRVCVSAQHRGMLDQTLRLFEIVPDYDLDIMCENQSPTQVAAAVLSRLEPVIMEQQPDWMLVQGDTTTSATAALAGFHARVRISHIEAGLRTGDKWQPFPEEINRRIVGLLADLHFAPTERARQNLLAEAIPADRIVVTGNPTIDALQLMLRRPAPAEINSLLRPDRRLILVTAHRRENFGGPLENICRALREIARRYEDVHLVYPVHENPSVREPVRRLLADVANITLLSPIDYLSLVHLANNCYMVVTDSGGLQEECPSLGKPVLVLRKVTERPEAVEGGMARVIGVDAETIIAEISRLLDERHVHESMSARVNLFGDGNSSARILNALIERSQPATRSAGGIG